MDDVISDVESAQVIESQLFALFNGAPQADPVEAVEYLVVGVAADLVLIVNETPVQILSDDEFGEQTSVPRKNRAQSFTLGLFLAVDQDFVAVLHLRGNVGGEQVEILVEYRLRGNAEVYRHGVLPGEGSVDEHLAERVQAGEEFHFPVHVRRVQPHHGVLRQYRGNRDSALRIVPGDDVRKNRRLVPDLAGELRVAVEHIDILHFVPEE